MRGNVMAQQTETAGVTMLRSPSVAPHPAFPQQENTVNTSPAGRSMNETGPNSVGQSAGDLPEAGGQPTRMLSRPARYGIASVSLLAGVVIIAFGANKAGLTIPFFSQARSPAQVMSVSHNNNTSGITPPDFNKPGSPIKEQTNEPTLSQTIPAHDETRPVTTISTGALPATRSPAIQADQALSPPAPPPSTAIPPVMEDVHGGDDQHFINRMQNASNSEQTVSQKPDPGNDKLFIEMHHQLDTMTSQMKELENKLETAQQALNERVSVGLGKIDGRLDELQHREDLIESQKKPEPAPQALPPKETPPNVPKVVEQATLPVKADHHVVKKISKEPAPAPLPHYTVQAGAPDIAILTDSAGTPVRVQPGSTLDGWGNVLSVVQSGNTWLVKTEHGTIR